jgi:hypothetical protein
LKLNHFSTIFSRLCFQNRNLLRLHGFGSSEVMLLVVVTGSAFRHHAIRCQIAPEAERLKALLNQNSC